MRRGSPAAGWPSIRLTNCASEAPVAASTLARLSVEGQRSLPSRVTRLDLLNVVGSRPARRARPEAVNPLSEASRSSARQMSLWRSMAGWWGTGLPTVTRTKFPPNSPPQAERSDYALNKITHFPPIIIHRLWRIPRGALHLAVHPPIGRAANRRFLPAPPSGCVPALSGPLRFPPARPADFPRAAPSGPHA